MNTGDDGYIVKYIYLTTVKSRFIGLIVLLTSVCDVGVDVHTRDRLKTMTVAAIIRAKISKGKEDDFKL